MTEVNKVLLFFAKPVYITITKFNFDKTVSLIEKLDFQDSGEIKTKNLNVNNISKVSKNLNVLENKNFFFLKEIIMFEFNKFKNEYLKYTNDFDITTSWFTKTLTNESSNYHNHKNCIFSGVLYIQTNENSGSINFINYNNSTSFLLPAKEYNEYNSNDYTIYPKNGLLVFFPSEIHHKILKNNSNNIRYSLAFNFFPNNQFGLGDSSTNLKIIKE
jgi:uncharacterized protein (TIGR02466 family)